MGKFKNKKDSGQKPSVGGPVRKIEKKSKNKMFSEEKKKVLAQKVLNGEISKKNWKPQSPKDAKKGQSNGPSPKVLKKSQQNETKKTSVESPKVVKKSQQTETIKTSVESQKVESKKDKKKNKKNVAVASGDDDFTDAMKKELEVFIKNLNRGGQIQNAFVVADDSVENVENDDDVVSIDGNYENVDENFDETEEKVEVKEEVEEAASDEKKKKKKNKKEKEAERKGSENAEFKKESETKESLKEEKNFKKEDRADYIFVKEVRKERTNCLLRPKAGEPWYEIVEKKSSDQNEDEDAGVETSQYWLMKIEKFAKKLLDEEVSNFTNLNSKETKKTTEKRFIETVLRSGTLNDKISAYVVMIQESPVHHLATLQTLIDMVSLKSRRPCMLALDALQNLFANSLLVPERKLRTFGQCPVRNLDRLTGGNKDTRDKYLMIWLFEQNLKTMYVKFLAALAEIGKDTIENTRMKVMSVILELLMSNPEQEQELLSRLINKLGDPVRRVAAKATYQIGLLLENHPAMKAVVLSEIERLLHRTNIATRAQYYGICCLTQLVLDEDEEGDRKMADKLIAIYFSFFKASIKKGDIDSKLVSALLTGVHRAYPFAVVDSEVMNAQVETMYKIAHMSTFNIALHAFMLLFQVMGSGGESVSDRFYNAFYKKLLSPDLSSSSKPALFLNLTFKVMKNDPSPNRVLAFTKRLLQLCIYWPAPLVCSTHFLISEVLKSRPEISLLNKVDETPAGEIEGKLKQFEDDDGEADDYRKDVPLSDEEEEKPNEASKKTASSSSWVHRNLLKTHVHASKASTYNFNERNPLYAGAEKSNPWELSTLAIHYHPSAALFGKTLLDGEAIKYSGDPLSDFTLMRFLDRFVFRNPKKDPFKNKHQNVFSKRNTYQAPAGVKRLAPDSKEYIDREESQVPLDERFIFRFFRDKQTRVSDKQDSDAESVNSDDAMEAIEIFAEKGDRDLDFASAVEPETGKKRKSKDDDSDASDDDDDDVDSLLESGDEDMSDVDELMIEDDDDEDFEEVDDFDGMEDDFDFAPKSSKPKMDPKLKKAKKMAASSADLFASAEEFSALIDESELDVGAGGIEQVSNKDRSAVKQLAWEKQRHSDFKGSGNKFSSKQKFKKNFSGGSKKKR